MSAAFLDTNILVYLFDRNDVTKRERAERLVRRLIDEEAGAVSFQVVQEALNTITRKSKANLGPQVAKRFLEDVLLRFWKVMPSVQLYRRALDVQERYQFSFYDSLIVAAALEYGCSTLFTEDFQHGQQIEGLHISNPFGD